MKYKYKNKIKRIVIKVGTSVLTYNTGIININRVKQIVENISYLTNQGYEVILVSSGAIGAGLGIINNNKNEKYTLSKKQAIAAIGQVFLMRLYQKIFAKHNKIIGQVLLTKDDFINKNQSLNSKNTILTLLKMKAIPIINENDTTAVDEIKVGDNDKLAALVASLINSDLLILLSDINGFYDSNPMKNIDAKLYKIINKITPKIENAAGNKISKLGTGGMITKIEAAKIAMSSGIYMIIGNGNKKEIIKDIIKGEFLGTIFVPKTNE